MCGITGIISQKNLPISQEELEKANDIIQHRGPDDVGYFRQDAIGLGHRRLSIIDLSEKGRQPMHYRERYTMVYNGEIYNYLELKAELETAGYQFHSETDSEVLLAAYAHWGAKCLERLNGMWSFAIFDTKEQKIFCARDRFGIKPFYYTQINEKFCFASEIKQFTVIKGWKAVLNKIRAYEFLIKGQQDHTSETLFSNVYQLRPGEQLLYDLNTHQYQVSVYYNLEKAITQLKALSFEAAKTKFHDLLEDAVRLRLRSDVKVGSALSGGLDSSSIVSLMSQQLNLKDADLEAISAVFPGHEINEEAYVDELVKKSTVQVHKVNPTADQLTKDLLEATWYQDEPIATSSILAQQVVFRAASERQIKVMLDGQGADEILAGYEVFYYPLFRDQLKRNPILALRNIYNYFKLHQITPPTALRKFWQALNRRKNTSVNWLNSDFIPESASLASAPSRQSILDISLASLSGQGMPLLLHYEDRNAMSASVESRLPFLDYRLVEYCLALPTAFKIHEAKRKYILREAMKDELPRSIYERYDKIGFEAPQAAWMAANRTFFDAQLKVAISEYPAIFNSEILTIKDDKLIWRIVGFYQWMKLFEVGVD